MGATSWKRSLDPNISYLKISRAGKMAQRGKKNSDNMVEKKNSALELLLSHTHTHTHTHAV